jgi:tol-pal system protein YbgF
MRAIPLNKWFVAFICLGLVSCATGSRGNRYSGPELDPVPATAPADGEAKGSDAKGMDGKAGAVKTVSTADELSQSREQISKLNDKVQDLETRLTALNDKINLEDGVKPNDDITAKVLANGGPRSGMQTEDVHTPAAHSKVIPLPAASKNDKKGGGIFVQNEAVDRFREAKILLDSKRYSDAIVEFSNFVKNYPEHALASAAQYFMGMGYAFEGEFKLAEEELSRGLMTYPHSNYVPDTLAALAEISDKLKKPARATYYKQKLLSSFPNSPQAKEMSQEVQKTSGARGTGATAAIAETSEAPVEKKTIRNADAVAKKLAEKSEVKAPTKPEAPAPSVVTAGNQPDEFLPDPNDRKVEVRPDADLYDKNVEKPTLPLSPNRDISAMESDTE